MLKLFAWKVVFQIQSILNNILRKILNTRENQETHSQEPNLVQNDL